MSLSRVCYVICGIIFLSSSLADEERPAEDLITQIIDDLNKLLNQSDPVMVEDIDFVFDQIDAILTLDHDVVEFPGEVLHLLEELGARVDLNGSYAATTVRDNIGLLMADATLENPILGMNVARRDTDIFTDESLQILDASASADVWLPSVSELLTTVPPSVRQQPRRVSFLVFRDESAFRTDDEQYKVNSLVVSVNVQNYTGLGPNEAISIYIAPRVEHMENMDHACGYWHFLEDGTGYWSEEGCTIFLYPSTLDPPMLDMCRCTNLAHFSRGLTPKPTTTTTTTTLSPQSQIQQILYKIQQLLESEIAPPMDDIAQIISQVDDLLDLEQDDLEFPGALLQSIDQLGVSAALNGSNTGTVIGYNIAMLIADTTPENPVQGISLASRTTDTFTKDSFKFLSKVDSSLLNASVSEMVVSLPESVTKDPRRVSFVVFRDARAFISYSQQYTVNSRVISVKAGEFAGLNDGEVMEIHLRPLRPEPNRNESRVCTSWNFLQGRRGYWSQEGCSLIRSTDPWMLDICRCVQLAHFAESLSSRPVFSQGHEDALRVLAVIGCSLSIFGLFAIAVTAVLFRSWRKSFRNQIWLQLCAALVIMPICFLVIVFAQYDEYSISCISTGAVLHFSILALFCWALIMSLYAYGVTRLGPNYSPKSSEMLIASSVGWGIPIVIVILLVGFRCYTEPFEVKNPSSQFCRPSELDQWLSFVTPIVIMSVASLGISFFVIYKLEIGPRNRHEEVKVENREIVAYSRTIFYLMVLTYLPPWIFDIFVYNIVVAYFFTYTATIQGFYVFLIIVCNDKSVGNFWLHKLRLRGRGEMIER